MPTPINRIVRIDSPSMTRIRRTLRKVGSLDERTLAALACITRRTAREYVRYLRRRRLIHIGGWVRNRNGSPSPIWTHGRGKDAPPLEKKDHLAYTREYKEKTGWYDIQKALRRANRTLARPNRITAALMGL